MLVSEQLRAAWALIDSPNKWVKGKDRGLGPGGETAYCSRGALLAAGCCTARAADYLNTAALLTATRYGWRFPGKYDLYILANDYSQATHATLRYTWETAIKNAERDEQVAGLAPVPPKPRLLSDILAAEALAAALENDETETDYCDEVEPAGELVAV